MKTEGNTRDVAVRVGLINTPLQRGGGGPGRAKNRFNGFGHARETVETVLSSCATDATPLKRGVNETASRRSGLPSDAWFALKRSVNETPSHCSVPFRIPHSAFRTPHSAFHPSSAFTLLELLVVIGIIGILAALSVPVLNNFKPNHSANATRVLMDDLSRARQLAISEHTTVLMVFVKTNFWDVNLDKAVASWQPADWLRATNLANKQLIGYTFVSLRSLGDQPGVHTPQYLSGWKTLPEGGFLTLLKFTWPSGPPAAPFTINTNQLGTTNPVAAFPLYGFNYTAQVPFPRLETPVFSPRQPYVLLPYIAFNYLGQRCDDNGNVLQQNALFALAKGNLSFPRDPATHNPRLAPPTLFEQPPGNATNAISYNLVQVDWLTGRARAIQQEVR